MSIVSTPQKDVFYLVHFPPLPPPPLRTTYAGATTVQRGPDQRRGGAEQSRHPRDQDIHSRVSQL